MKQIKRIFYPTDLNDKEWKILKQFLIVKKLTGRPRKYSIREILNAIFYILRSGCSWRMMPHDSPNWKTVYHYFRLWRIEKIFERIHDSLFVSCRVKSGKNWCLSLGIIDSQTVKTTESDGEKGYDCGKVGKDIF